MAIVANNISGMNMPLGAAGLKPKPTYEQVIDYILRDPEIICYPNRFAKQIRDSPWLTQLDGEGMRQMEQHQIEQMKEMQQQKNNKSSCSNE